jgi:hypothetical protein
MQPLIGMAIALSLAPLDHAEAQTRSAVATVQLTAIMPPGASFRPALGLTVNAAYRVEVHRARGPNITLMGDARAGLVPLKAADGGEEARRIRRVVSQGDGFASAVRQFCWVG